MRTLALILLLSLVTGSLEAQNRRRGFWVGLGLGPASIGSDCNSCSTDRTNGAGGYLRLGGTLSQNVLLGVEASGWGMTVNGVQQSLGVGSAVLLWYPSRRGAFYFKFGAGGLTYKWDNGFIQRTESAPSASLGVGYEARVWPNVSIVPFANAYGSSRVDTRINGVPVVPSQDFNLNMIQFGVGLTWH